MKKMSAFQKSNFYVALGIFGLTTVFLIYKNQNQRKKQKSYVPDSDSFVFPKMKYMEEPPTTPKKPNS